MEAIRERLIDIQKFWDTKEFICKHCGSVYEVDDMPAPEFTNNRYKLSCSACGGFIKWLKQSKVARVWWKGSMQEIAKLETGLIGWMINNNFGNAKTQEFLYKEIHDRMVRGTYKPTDETRKFDNWELYASYPKEELRQLSIIEAFYKPLSN